MDLTFLLSSCGINVHIEGRPQSGKSSLLRLLNLEHRFSTGEPSDDWSEQIKRTFTFVRKEKRHIVIDIKD